MPHLLVGTLLPRRPAEAAPVLQQPPQGVDYVELRLDALDEPTPAVVTELLALPRSVPVLATCRSAPGLEDTATRHALLAAAGEAGAELLDIEDSELAGFPASVPGSRMASCHVSRFLPRLDALARRVAGHDTKFAKLAVGAKNPAQLSVLLQLQEEMTEETGGRFSLVPTGPLAEAGRVMAAGRGAALGFGALDGDRRGHLDQPTVERLHGVFHIGVVAPTTRFFAVIGNPVAHSMSPAYHNTVFRGAGTDARFVALEVNRVTDVIDHAEDLRLDGFAVTYPLKQEALDLAVTVLPGAEAVGAANTLVRTPAGWQARNTDWKAACELMPRLLRRWRRAHPDRTPKVLLLGAGGAARAVAVALLEQDVELAVWSRRLSNARSLAEALSGTLPALAVPDPGHYPADLVINATPIGMADAPPAEIVLSPDWFRPEGFAVDLAYGNPESPFRAAAAAAGANLTTGEDFFRMQAKRQAAIFTAGGVPDDVWKRAAQACTG